MLPERRFTPSEVRFDEDAGQLVGYAAVFYDGTPATEYSLWDEAVERIDREAFAKKKHRDTAALFNHNPDNVLGREPKTLKLTIDQRGLHYAVDLPDTGLGDDLKRLVARGDIAGSSFQFVAAEEEWTTEEGRSIRTIIRADPVIDVGPVTFPAYTGTSVDLRQARECHDLWKQRLQHEADESAWLAEKRARWLKRGQSLGSFLSRQIDEQTSDNRPRGDVIQAIASAAEIEPGTVNQIVDGSISCPPRNRLAAFARVLDVSIDSVLAAARRDGCEYD